MQNSITVPILLALEAIVVVFGSIGLGWWLQRRLGVRWSTWAWGALAFVGSQALRLPFLTLLTVLLAPIAPEPDSPLIFWINFAILGVTSGLFEESARYVVMRWLAKAVRSWREAVMFGAGHSGIEAILLVGLSAAVSLVVFVTGETLLAQLEVAAPEQAEALAMQLEALRGMGWWLPLLAVWERVLAITFHIAASILVMWAVRQGQVRWWALAVTFHTVFNWTALLALRYGGDIAAEVALTAVSIISVTIIVLSRRAEEADVGA